MQTVDQVQESGLGVLKNWLRSRKRLFKEAVLDDYDLIVEDKYAVLKVMESRFDFGQLDELCRDRLRTGRYQDDYVVFLVSGLNCSGRCAEIYEIPGVDLLQAGDNPGAMVPGMNLDRWRKN